MNKPLALSACLFLAIALYGFMLSIDRYAQEKYKCSYLDDNFKPCVE